MIKLPSLLIFNHFFENLIWKVTWKFYMIKEVLTFLYQFKLGHNFASW